MFNTIEVVASMGAACEKLLKELDWLARAISLRAKKGMLLLEPMKPEPLEGSEVAREAAATLGQLLDSAHGWWTSEVPPAFAPDATSAAEGLMFTCLRTCAAHDAPEGAPMFARCRFAEIHRPKFDAAAVGAAIRCELAAMLRRPSPQATAINAMIGDTSWWRHWDDADDEIRAEMYARLPREWSKLTAEQRVAAIEEAWAAFPKPEALRAHHLPNWRDKERCLYYAGRIVRRYKREAPNQFLILTTLQEAGWPDRGVEVPGLAETALEDTITDFNKTAERGTIQLHMRGRLAAWRDDAERSPTSPTLERRS